MLFWWSTMRDEWTLWEIKILTVAKDNVSWPASKLCEDKNNFHFTSWPQSEDHWRVPFVLDEESKRLSIISIIFMNHYIFISGLKFIMSCHENAISVTVTDLVMGYRENALETTKASKVINLRHTSGDSPESKVNQHLCLRQRFQFRREKSLVTPTKLKPTERWVPVYVLQKLFSTSWKDGGVITGFHFRRRRPELYSKCFIYNGPHHLRPFCLTNVEMMFMQVFFYIFRRTICHWCTFSLQHLKITNRQRNIKVNVKIHKRPAVWNVQRYQNFEMRENTPSIFRTFYWS